MLHKRCEESGESDLPFVLFVSLDRLVERHSRRAATVQCCGDGLQAAC
jgi:hypothetical protein